MSFDIGDVLTQAWQITWRNKSLWWFGIIIALAISPIFLFMLLPFFIPFLTESQAVNSNPSIILLTMMGFVLLSIIFFVVLYISSTLINTAVILGIWRAAEGKERVALIELLKDSLPFFWRVLGIMFLYTAALMIVNIGIQVFTLLISLVTLGLGALCAMPLMFLLYPVMFIGSVWLELAINSIVIDKMTIMEAARNGWRMIRNNVLAIILVTVVIYFGTSIFSSIMIVPVMVPFFMVPFALLDGNSHWIILAVAVLFGLLSVPVFALITGVVSTFARSVWVMAYLRLTRSAKPNVELQEATA
jgi:hypothetical protein